nr:hypothetical protein pPsy0462b_00026 [Pseudomonas syringae]
MIYDFLRPEGPVVKASSVHPTLTKFRLEAHIGAFEGPPPSNMKNGAMVFFPLTSLHLNSEIKTCVLIAGRRELRLGWT